MERNEEGQNVGRWVDERMAILAPADEWEPNVPRGLAHFRAKREEVRRPRQRWAWVAAASLVICISLMATPVTRAFAQRCLSACVNETGWVRQILNVGTSGARSNTVYAPEARRMAPDFTLADASGTPVSLADYRGKVVLLNFWATWCFPCRAEIPLLMEFEQAYRGRGFVVLGVSMDDDGWKAVKPYLHSRKMNYPVMVADRRTPELFGGLKAIPETLIIDRRGRIAATHLGLCQKSEYENDIKAVLNESAKGTTK